MTTVAMLDKITNAGRDGVGQTAVYASRTEQKIRTVPMFDVTLLVVEQGVKTLQQGSFQVVVPAGSAVLVAAGSRLDVHNCPDADSGDYRACVISFADVVIPATATLVALSGNHLPPWQCVTPTVVESIGFRAALDHGVSGLADPQLADTVVRHRLQEILLVLQAAGVPCPPPQRTSLREQVRRLIMQAPDQPWSLALVAQRMVLSEATLRRRLAEEGLSFRDILTESRLVLGLELLQTSRHSITAVALACGYESPSRFSERFRQRFGISPSALRGERKSCAVGA